MATNRNSSSTGHKPWVRTAIKALWIGFAAAVVFAAVFFILVYNGVIGYMPPIEELKNPQDKFASVIYTSDGKEMGRYFRNTGNRVYADFDEISPSVVDALIATEDARFNDHSGIDVKAIARAIIKTVLLQNKNAAACQAALHAAVARFSGASRSEAHRVDDCHQTGTLLLERGDT